MSKENTSKIYLKLIVCMIFVFAILPFITSAPPVTTVQSFPQGLVIEYPVVDYLKFGEDFTFHFHVFNASTGNYLVTNTNCSFHLYNSTGNHIFQGYDDTVSDTYDYAFKILNGNFSKVGSYYYITQCKTGDFGGYTEHGFEVKVSGAGLTEGRAVLYGVLIFVLVLFLFGAMILFVKFDHLLVRIGMFGLSYLLLISVSFIGWQIANEIILATPFIVQMFRLIFIVLIIGAFPLLLGSLAWYVIMLFRIKEIERLMEKGLPYDEAEHRVNRRKR